MQSVLINNSLCELFPEVSYDIEMESLLKEAKILNINVYKKARKLEILLELKKLYPIKTIIELKEKLSHLYQLSCIDLKLKYDLGLDLNEILLVYWKEILYYINQKIVLTKGIMSNCSYEISKSKLNIYLHTNGCEILRSQKCDLLIQDIIYEWFDIRIKIEFFYLDCQDKQAVDDAYLNEKIDKESKIVDKIIDRKCFEGKVSNTDLSFKGETKLQKLKCERKKLKPSDILGNEITDRAMNISDVTQDSGTVCIEGEIFRIETRETKNGKFLFIFDMTNYTSSITVKFWLKAKELSKKQEKIVEGAYVKVRGDAQYDKFSRELSIFALDIERSKNSIQERQDNAYTKRVELHLHTQMSSMDGVSSIKELVKRASSWGHRAIAVTDHGVVQAYPEAYEASKKYKMKIIYGVECYLYNDNDFAKVDFKKARTYHGIILVKSFVGLKNLYKIISESHLKYYHKRPRIPKSLINQYREGLILGGACEAGEVYSAIVEKKSCEEIENIIKFYDYLEIQPLLNNEFMIKNQTVSGIEELKEINRKIVALGEKFDLMVVATCDVHFMDPRDEVFRRILMAGKGFADADKQAPLYFRTTEEMLEEFSYLGSLKAFEVVVKNTNAISDLIEHIIPIPDGTFPPQIDGAEREIRFLADQKSKKIYGDVLPQVVEERLTKELNSIIKNGFSVMYIIAQKLVWKSLSDGYLVGSRGSVGSSFVANMIGITEVNSLPPHYICTKCKYSEFIIDASVGCGFDLKPKYCPACKVLMKTDGYDIPFETFLGFDGDKEPDIDLNFSGEYQLRAHKYTEELFGEGHVFRAGTIGTIAEKTAYGFIKNYMDERNKIITNAEINRLVKGCTGVKRTTGQHPGGLMIVPQDREIYEFCPVQRPADDPESDIITTHFDYDSISGRLLKLDILGHDDPTVIKMLEDLTGVDARTIPIGEEKTMGIFSSTEPLGIRPEDINSEVGTFAIPEFGTKFVRQMLVDTKPKTFSELIRISGLSHGTDVWLNNAQDLIRGNTATLSEVICTRDDIMLYLIYAGLPNKTAFKIMEDVRKGKKLKEEYIQIMYENKVPSWYIESCQKIKYMFPKAHAAAYVMMAFRIAWFKVYYPESFYVTYFTVKADDFDADLIVFGQDKVKNKIKELEQLGNNITQKERNILTILEVANEAYARGIKFLPVDIYESDPIKFLITNKGIRPPLIALQGLGKAAAQNIGEARYEMRFISKDNLVTRAKISKTVVEILESHGCLKKLPESSQISIFELVQ